MRERLDPVKGTTQTSLHSVLAIVAAIPRQAVCYANSTQDFSMMIPRVRQSCPSVPHSARTPSRAGGWQ